MLLARRRALKGEVHVMLDLLIRKGTVVLADQTVEADVGIQGEKIVELGRLGERPARDLVDASGQYVFPGLIDPHLHLAHPFRDTRSSDDFYTGTCAAVAGGNTAIVDFAIQWTGDPLEALATRMKEATGQAVIDYGFHACLTKSNPSDIGCVPQLVERGLPSFKVYMVYRRQGRMMDDGGLLAMLQKTAAQGGITGVHAENEDIADYNLKRFQQSGQLGPAFFPDYKPSLVEAEAINRVLFLNRHARSHLYIFHLSTREGLELVDQARADGQSVRAETCVHYLVLDRSVYDTDDGAHFICSPPLRARADVDALWDGIATSRIAIVSSDHCGFSAAQKVAYGSKFPEVPNGLPGVETRLSVMHSAGVVTGRITVNRLVALLSTNPAKIFGLYPEKGTLAPGSDADITLFDPDARRVLTGADLVTPAGWSPFEGLEVQGWPTYVISRGEVLLKEGRVSAQPGRGRFLRRTLPTWT
jgi:dihydropyrimidinase